MPFPSAVEREHGTCKTVKARGGEAHAAQLPLERRDLLLTVRNARHVEPSLKTLSLRSDARGLWITQLQV